MMHRPWSDCASKARQAARAGHGTDAGAVPWTTSGPRVSAGHSRDPRRPLSTSVLLTGGCRLCIPFHPQS